MDQTDIRVFVARLDLFMCTYGKAIIIFVALCVLVMALIGLDNLMKNREKEE